MIKIISGAFITILAACALFLGAMFLIASSGVASRLATAVVMLAAGACLFAAGIKLLRTGMGGLPGFAAGRILKAAAKHNGSVPEDVLMAETGGGDAVGFELSAMLRNGRVRQEAEGGRKVYIFPELQFSLRYKKCPYCGSDYPVRENIERCPSCGGDLKIVTDKSGGAEDKFSMDI